MTFWPVEKRAQMKELKQARFNIMQYINYLDRFRCEGCSGRVQVSGIYADKTKCDCEAASKIRKLGEVLLGNRQEIIEKFKELKKMTVLESLTEDNLTKEKYLELKAQGLTDRQIQDAIGWHGVKFNQWKRKENLIGQRSAPTTEERTGEPAEASTVSPTSTIKAAIINDIAKRIDQQTEKGVGKYSHTLDDCPQDKYDWQDMILEELIDALQYQQKEIRRLKDDREMTFLQYQELSKRTMPTRAITPEEHKHNRTAFLQVAKSRLSQSRRPK